MPEHIRFPEFRDQFEPTLYPFTDTATLSDSNTGQSIDRDMFLDASLYPVGAVGFLYISQIFVAEREVTISISDQTRNVQATATFDPVLPPESLSVVDAFDRPAGILVSSEERLSRFSGWGIGAHAFSPTASRFLPSCVIPTPEVGVRGILTDRGDLFTGDVILVGENGVVVREGSDSESVRIDIVGDPLFIRKLCVPIDLFVTPRFVKSINGCVPDQYGNINIIVGDHQNPETILRVYPDDDGLKITAIGSTVQRG